MDKTATYKKALEIALEMGFEAGIRSSLKEGGRIVGIPYGDEMGAFVEWAEDRLGVSS
jgi:hypothetical protein